MTIKRVTKVFSSTPGVHTPVVGVSVVSVTTTVGLRKIWRVRKVSTLVSEAPPTTRKVNTVYSWVGEVPRHTRRVIKVSLSVVEVPRTIKRVTRVSSSVTVNL